MSLKYEPSSEPLHISAQPLFLNPEINPTRRRASASHAPGQPSKTRSPTSTPRARTSNPARLGNTARGTTAPSGGVAPRARQARTKTPRGSRDVPIARTVLPRTWARLPARSAGAARAGDPRPSHRWPAARPVHCVRGSRRATRWGLMIAMPRPRASRGLGWRTAARAAMAIRATASPAFRCAPPSYIDVNIDICIDI